MVRVDYRKPLIYILLFSIIISFAAINQVAAKDGSSVLSKKTAVDVLPTELVGEVYWISNNMPLRGATIELIGSANVIAESDIQGKFVIENAPSGIQLIKVVTKELEQPFYHSIDIKESAKNGIRIGIISWNKGRVEMFIIKDSKIADKEITYVTPTTAEVKPYAPKVKHKEYSAFAFKTNLLYDMTSTINLGMEFRLSKRLTMDISANYNPFKFSNKKRIKHIMAQPELRYWINEPFKGSFLGFHTHFAHFDVGKRGFTSSNKSKHFKGNLYGAGISYGYQWKLGRSWSMETSIGMGYARIHYKRLECQECDQKPIRHNKNYFGPTKVSLSLLFHIW